jgi:hypothetical protein
MSGADRIYHPLLGAQISDVDVIGEDLAALAFDQADRLENVGEFHDDFSPPAMPMICLIG